MDILTSLCNKFRCTLNLWYSLQHIPCMKKLHGSLKYVSINFIQPYLYITKYSTPTLHMLKNTTPVSQILTTNSSLLRLTCFLYIYTRTHRNIITYLSISMLTVLHMPSYTHISLPLIHKLSQRLRIHANTTSISFVQRSSNKLHAFQIIFFCKAQNLSKNGLTNSSLIPSYRTTIIYPLAALVTNKSLFYQCMKSMGTIKKAYDFDTQISLTFSLHNRD